MNWLNSIICKEKKLAIGLMSGTSMDGIDAAIVKIKGSGLEIEIELVDFICDDYSPETEKLLKGLDSHYSFEKLSDLNFVIGKEFSVVAENIIKKNNYKNPDIDFIGSHGQTVYHNPPSLKNNFSSTFQIGESDVISEQTGITTIGDFRKKDVASGGEGAPFIPYVDFILFRKLEKNVIAQNIGGIANCTFVSSSWNNVIAYDSGPGNSLIDSVINIATNGEKKIDKEGDLASKGSVNNKLLNKLLNHPYFSLPLPKSTGKELFGVNMAREIYSVSQREGIKIADLLCTLVEFTVESIALSYEKFIFPSYEVDEIVVSGGGAFNKFMMQRFRKRLPKKMIVFSSKYGISVDAKEAVGFAIYANETLHGNSTGISKITGAVNNNVLGKISIGRNNLKDV